MLSPKQLDGEEVIPLKFVKFQNVQVNFTRAPVCLAPGRNATFHLQNIQFFLSDNQGGEEITQVDFS